MALKPVAFPAVYERITKPRTDDEIFRDMNSRFDSPASEPRTTASTPMAPPPPDQSVRPSKTIGKIASDLPRRSKAGRKRNPALPCPQHVWYNIGKAKTPGKIRQRCRTCKREETVLESQGPKRAYKKSAGAPKGQQ